MFNTYKAKPIVNANGTNTKTYTSKNVSEKISKYFDISALKNKLAAFNEKHKALFEADRSSLYYTFHIPKKTGGLRRIDAPNDDLKDALRELKTILEADFHAPYHTSAFAYVKKRSTIEAVKRHQANESRWFAKYDLSDFFGSTTFDFVIQQLSNIYPFCEVMSDAVGMDELSRSLSLAFLNGGLPQGTPISPLITNVMMIPFDHKLSNILRDFDKQSFVYTRYADDILISSKRDFDYKKVEALIIAVLAVFEAPFKIKTEKTRYGSSAGRNWNLGVMLNKDNEITIGSKKKRQFQSMLYTYIKDKKNGTNWDITDVQTLNGYYSYYKMVEGETIERIVSFINQKHGANVLQLIKNDLKGV